MAKEGLHARLQLIHLLANTRHNIIQQVKPDTPTKALEPAALLKTALGILAERLADPEPPTATLTQEQISLASITNSEVAIRARKLVENIERVEQTLLADHTGSSVLTWTDKERQRIEDYLSQETAALQEAIGRLV